MCGKAKSDSTAIAETGCCSSKTDACCVGNERDLTDQSNNHNKQGIEEDCDKVPPQTGCCGNDGDNVSGVEEIKTCCDCPEVDSGLSRIGTGCCSEDNSEEVDVCEDRCSGDQQNKDELDQCCSSTAQKNIAEIIAPVATACCSTGSTEPPLQTSKRGCCAPQVSAVAPVSTVKPTACCSFPAQPEMDNRCCNGGSECTDDSWGVARADSKGGSKSCCTGGQTSSLKKGCCSDKPGRKTSGQAAKSRSISDSKSRAAFMGANIRITFEE